MLKQIVSENNSIEVMNESVQLSNEAELDECHRAPSSGTGIQIKYPMPSNKFHLK